MRMPKLPGAADSAVPVEESEAVEMDAPPVEPKVSKPIEKPIEVVAIRAGFYAQGRRPPGQKFQVAKFTQLGSWMKCVDPEIQKKHALNMKARKEQKRQKASE